MTEVSGIGERVALTVVAYGGNLERFTDARAFAAYTGLTPMRKQSGEKEGKARISRMGPSALRQAFYIAARVAVMKDERYRAYYERKRAEGKAHRLVMDGDREETRGRSLEKGRGQALTTLTHGLKNPYTPPAGPEAPI